VTGRSGRSVVLVNKWGLHARAAFSLAKTARGFESEIRVEKNGNFADGKDVGDLLTLCAARGETITITAEGPDCHRAVERIASLAESGFHEKDDT